MAIRPWPSPSSSRAKAARPTRRPHAGGWISRLCGTPAGEVAVGHATLRLANGRLELRPELLAGGGTITAVGLVTLGDTLGYEVREGRIDRVDLGKLSGDTTAAPLTGRFTLAGRGTAPAEARMTAGLHFDELRYGERRVERVDVTARLDRGRLHVEGDGALQGGRLVLEALGRPFDSTASYVLRRAALEGVDLGTLLGQPALAGPVTLSMTGEARLRGESRSALARVTMDPSRLGRVDVSAAAPNVRLAGEQLTYDASLQTTGGALSLAGDGSIATGAPSTASATAGSWRSTSASCSAGPTSRPTSTPRSRRTSREARPTVSAPRSRWSCSRRAEPGGAYRRALDARVNGRNVAAKLRAEGPDAALEATLDATPVAMRMPAAARRRAAPLPRGAPR